jgi:2-(1,2-epoxy-1,2-dihydrophenyl)acetyl-CoA isomerase
MAIECSGGVARLEVGAAIGPEWIATFDDALAELSQRDDVRVVLLAGDGRFFCPGGDLRWIHAQEDRSAAVAELAGSLHRALERLAALPAPTVARVHAPAAGAGMSLVLATDIAIAGASASFTAAYTAVGLSPDGGMTWSLPRIVGRRRAMELMLRNRRVDAAEAASLGIVTSSVPDDELDAAVDEVVGALAAGPTESYAAVKRLLATSSDSSLADQLAAEAASIARLAGGPGAAEGMDAFLEKRPPVYAPPPARG